MSEYQYYEFKAVDKPLTEKDMQALRNLSTRARITPTSFVNEYNWGDFKGNLLKLEKHIASRNVAGRYLKEMESIVILKRERSGRDVFYINTGLYDLFMNFPDMH